MRTQPLVISVVLAALGAACVALPRPTCTAAPGAPAIAITLVYGMNAPTARIGRDLQVAAWPDGRLVWAIDPDHPDAGWLESRVEPEHVAALLDDLCARGVFEDEDFWRPHYGPDGDYVVIQLVSGTDCIRLRSWHELFGMSGFDLMDGREASRRFLAAWSDIRMTVAGWIPATGVPCAEPMDLKGMW